MLSIGVGPALILAVVLGATVFHIPVVILAPAAALVMCLAAYGVSRNANIFHLGSVVVGVVIGRMMVKSINSALAGQGQQIPEWQGILANALTSNGVVIAVSVIAFIAAMLLGIFGPLGNLRKADEVAPDGKSR
ncbi:MULTISPECIES: hypothetical protein [Ralstonia]|jgi:hypothetical protein|uniref:Uncharacterized protein n=2 Tax=Ralstonia pickettii TaxID=329 RepID=R0E975_RALPI|nr:MULTISPECIES: hypothetical protein [Ralstonia]ENZ77967.1 hypothetical protein OR214_02243 [Ralstonia pickettii OR214]MCM3581938.1 hypothetical protein [Ralstonia pickettii]